MPYQVCFRLFGLDEPRHETCNSCIWRLFWNANELAERFQTTVAFLPTTTYSDRKAFDSSFAAHSLQLLYRLRAVSHFLHGADVDTYGTAMFGLKMLSSYEGVARYPVYVYTGFGRFSEWVPP